MTGMLIGVGLGPGDPDLMTLRAARVIGAAEVVAYPTLPGTDSFARSIAADLIRPDADEIVIEVPMTKAREPAQAAYEVGAERIAAALEAGRDVAVLCEGDPFFYGSFMYLHSRLAERFPVTVIPGITSVSAATAGALRPLVARNEVLTVLPGPIDSAMLASKVEQAEAVVIMKVGRHLSRIRDVLDQLGLAEQAIYVERATLDAERILPLAEAPDPAPYFSLILVTKGSDPWL
ncbi:precorrin-2 C(20)-methyltransferase [Maritimibacter sp. UBA3975]|uniref:precorrin-2 C(20)-methyltransferase n=1 Tax=Maritimibacter sp. UBA3975 TaxID=1946833 RepID=UPI000C0B9096|nr:precorrin-2 C(20)-methyltransferase [Maritimibacter sp. UBA3975]MAM61911.1 precorrin-2 C(20)-methyltransferase [Maritimibacter sp.]|tara:strand:- start:50646 stop:51347 length:702 start_codon:yes stop_codon:yes gene_type:complete